MQFIDGLLPLVNGAVIVDEPLQRRCCTTTQECLSPKLLIENNVVLQLAAHDIPQIQKSVPKIVS